MRLALVAALAFTLAGCRWGKLTEGACTGTWGGRTLTGATLDGSSQMRVVRKQTCDGHDTFTYALSWGDGGVTARFDLVNDGPSVTGARDYVLPSDALKNLVITPGEVAPTGSLKLGLRGLEGDRTGTLVLKNNTEEMSCTFAISYETEGSLLYCEAPDGGG